MLVDHDTAWQALIDRDATRNDVVYAVRTTGVYCRIGCPARRPRRENVEFFAEGSAAAAAGYRPCRRCRPEDAVRPVRPDAVRVDAVVQRIADDHEPRTVAQIAADVGCSARHLDRTFRKATGVGVAEYRRELSRRRARVALRTSADVTSAVWDSGYRSTHGFYEQVVPTLGMTPKDYRSGGAGHAITFATTHHDIGVILVASTPVGVCSIRIGPDAASLDRELRDEFPTAEIRHDDSSLEPLMELVRALADGREPDAEIPLDVAGTAFQIQVWDALRRLRRGDTISYGELARRIGRPEASRAVGAAVGANRVALAVPCHRIVRSDGTIGGYRWGVEVKQALLKAEAAPVE